MMAAAPAFTLSMASPMLPVVSARKKMSGLGGMAGVATVLLTVKLPPGLTVAVTVDGLTPSAKAGAAKKMVVRINGPVTRSDARRTEGTKRMVPPSST